MEKVNTILMFWGVEVEAVQDSPQARYLCWDQEAEPGARKSRFDIFVTEKLNLYFLFLHQNPSI